MSAILRKESSSYHSACNRPTFPTFFKSGPPNDSSAVRKYISNLLGFTGWRAFQSRERSIAEPGVLELKIKIKHYLSGGSRFEIIPGWRGSRPRIGGNSFLPAKNKRERLIITTWWPGLTVKRLHDCCWTAPTVRKCCATVNGSIRFHEDVASTEKGRRPAHALRVDEEPISWRVSVPSMIPSAGRRNGRDRWFRRSVCRELGWLVWASRIGCQQEAMPTCTEFELHSFPCAW